MEITINNRYLISKLVPITFTYEFDVQKFIKRHGDIKSEDEVEEWIYDYLLNNTEYLNKVHEVLDGDNLEDYEQDYFSPEISKLYKLVEEILDNLPNYVKPTCCDNEDGNYCSVCGKQLKN